MREHVKEYRVVGITGDFDFVNVTLAECSEPRWKFGDPEEQTLRLPNRRKLWVIRFGDTIRLHGEPSQAYKVTLNGKRIFYSLRGHLQHAILGRQPDFGLFLLAVALATIVFGIAELLSR